MIKDPTLVCLETRIAELTSQLADPALSTANRKFIWQSRLEWQDKLAKYHDDHPMGDIISKLYISTQRLAIKEVERLARKIMKANPEITGFCNAMGSTFFRETCPETEEESAKVNELIDDADERLKEMDDFVCEWDSKLHFSGYPMKLESHDGELITDW